jgi:hypothetical protein
VATFEEMIQRDKARRDAWATASLEVRRTRLQYLVSHDARPMADISRDAGLHPDTLRQILSGYRPNPTIDVVGRILAELGRRWADLD